MFGDPLPAASFAEEPPVESKRSVIWSWIWKGCVVATTLLLIVGWQIFQAKYSGHARDVQRYEQLKSILDEIRVERAGASPNFDQIREKGASIGATITREMRKQANRDSPAKQLLLWAARDDLPRLLKEDLLTVSKSEMTIAERLDDIAMELDLPESAGVPRNANQARTAADKLRIEALEREKAEKSEPTEQ